MEKATAPGTFLSNHTTELECVELNSELVLHEIYHASDYDPHFKAVYIEELQNWFPRELFNPTK